MCLFYVVCEIRSTKAKSQHSCSICWIDVYWCCSIFALWGSYCWFEKSVCVFCNPFVLKTSFAYKPLLQRSTSFSCCFIVYYFLLQSPSIHLLKQHISHQVIPPFNVLFPVFMRFMRLGLPRQVTAFVQYLLNFFRIVNIFTGYKGLMLDFLVFYVVFLPFSICTSLCWL